MILDEFGITVLESKDVLLSEIIIESRARENLGDIDGLVESIRETGLIHPVALDKNKRLISGFRRYKAHEKLGTPTIRAEVFDLDITKADGELYGRVIELEENVRREGMTWDEQSRLRIMIHDLRTKLHGAKVHKRDPDGWSAAMTAKLVGVSPATICMDKQLVEGMKLYPQLARCESRDTAVKKLSKIKERMLLTELARRKAKDAKEAYRIYHGDCRDLIKSIPDESIHTVICDLPWGIGADKGARTEESYNDDPKRALVVQLDMLPELYRVMRPQTVMWYFFGIQYYNFLSSKLRDLGFEVRIVPCIWVKPNPSLAVDNKFGTQYESFFMVSKGPLRFLSKPRGDAFTYARVASQKAIAAAEKPVELIMELLELVSVEKEMILDPSMGSGVTIEAALRLNRRAIGFEEDVDLFNKIQFRLDRFDPDKTSNEDFAKEVFAEGEEEEELEKDESDFDEEIDLAEEE